MNKKRDNSIKEGAILFLVGAAQFVNILDFTIVLPLGPDFANHLDIKSADLGWVEGRLDGDR